MHTTGACINFAQYIYTEREENGMYFDFFNNEIDVNYTSLTQFVPVSDNVARQKDRCHVMCHVEYDSGCA